MVNFDKFGKYAGEKGYPPINDRWRDLPKKQKSVIRAIIKHPEKKQGEIAKIAGCDSSHVHKVIHSLTPEQFNRYKGEAVEEVEVGLDPQDMDVDENGFITVEAPMRMIVTVSIPKRDLENATSAAISQDAVITGVEGQTSN